uniref:Vacuolar protein sorting-associated protein 54 N-terminal domain-containing protein n=1 Tax=Oncorhynchus tshawytscha TaxID=74940 RepID=A0A8C8C1K8_ONCTS
MFLSLSFSLHPLSLSHHLSPPPHLSLISQEELREMREHPIDPQAEQEIINSIQEVYYSDDSFDMKLPTELNLQELEEYRNKLKRQQAAVSAGDEMSSIGTELERVTSLQTNLQLAAVICTNARCVSKEDFTEASLGLLANQRRRQLLTWLLKPLRTIKTLQGTDLTMSSPLNSKLQDTLEQIEEQLDVALSKTCKHFDVSHYSRVQLAYTVLGKSQTAMDQVHMHFSQAIHNTVFQVVLGYFQKMQYRDLCTHITPDSYFPCLSDLCKALWEVMLSYHRTMQWHEERDKEDSATATDTADTVVDHSYVKKKLEHGLTRIWQEVQLEVKTFLLGTDMSNFKYDDFIVVLDVISRLMQVGEEFCGSKLLQESIKRQSVNYFKNYHRTRLEELQLFLEGETWDWCPVKSNFNITQLHVSKTVKTPCHIRLVSEPLNCDSTFSILTLSLFDCLEGNPFERHIDNKDGEPEDMLASNGVSSGHV